MVRNSRQKFSLSKLFLSTAIALILSGCSVSLKYLTDRNNLVKIPQIVVSVAPELKENSLHISGKVLLENPSQSDLKLEKLFFDIKDESGGTIEQAELSWQKSSIKSLERIEAPLDIKLPGDILNKNELHVFLKTNILYQKLNIKIPFNNKVAILQLANLKNSLKGPMLVTIYSALKPDILGNMSVDYVLELSNPFSIDLLLSGGLKIYFDPSKIIGEAKTKEILVKENDITQIKDTIVIEENLKKIIFDELVKNGSQLKMDFSGDLTVAKTDIKIPFRIKAVQSIDFSLFPKTKD
jgi:hypothetical protein